MVYAQFFNKWTRKINISILNLHINIYIYILCRKLISLVPIIRLICLKFLHTLDSDNMSTKLFVISSRYLLLIYISYYFVMILLIVIITLLYVELFEITTLN